MKPSNQTRWWILGASHLAMAAIGLLIASQHSGGAADAESKQASNSSATTVTTPSSDKGASRKGTSFKSSTTWRGSEYARAWKALPHAKLTAKERLRVQRELLEKWAQTDLTAAIDAALAEAWDRENGEYYDPNGPLLDVLWNAIGNDPAGVWEMIRGRQFGVATGMLRHQWIQAVGKSDPVFLASKMSEISWRDRDSVLSSLTEDGISSETAQKLFAELAKQPADAVSAEMLLSISNHITGGLDPEQLQQDILALAGKDDRLAQVRAIQWGRQLGSLPASEIESQVAALPEALRSEVVWAAFDSMRKPENTLGLASLLASEGAWDKLESRDTVRQLQILASTGPDQARDVADWATDLPVRKETTELFHRSVDRYLRDNIDGARDWLATLPEGTWRDRAYAEYSQQALNAHNNPEASRWALDQIGNSTFKREAESWRSQWEKRTGWQAQ